MKFQIYAVGFFCMSLCASKKMSRKAIEHRANLESPTGISSQWQISEDKTFADGSANPHECENDSTCQHWLLNC